MTQAIIVIAPCHNSNIVFRKSP